MPPAATTGIGRDSVDDGRHEGHRRDLASDVTAGFPTLRDDDIDPGIDGSTSFGDVADSVEDDGPAFVGDRDQWRRVTPGRRHDPDTRVETPPKPFLLRPDEDQVDPERAVGQGSRPGELLVELGWARPR